TTLMPFMPGFRTAFRLRFFTLFWRGFYRLILLLTLVTGRLILCATIIRAISAASSTAPAATPFPRAFSLLFLWSTSFCWRALCGFLLCVFSFFITNHDGRHDFLGLNRSGLPFSAAHLYERRVPRTGDCLANGIAVLIFFHQEVGNVEESVALKANVYKSGLHARQDTGDAPFIDGACQCVFIFSF